MEIFSGIENLTTKFKKSVICIGNFDGIHYGHRKIIEQTVKLAKERNVKSLLITFSEHPRIIFAKKDNAKPLYILNTNKEKNQNIKNLGLDGILYLKSGLAFLTIEPEDFIKEIIQKQLNATAVIVGYDFHFGKGRKGDTGFLKQYGKKFGFNVIKIDAVEKNHEIVSSSHIRHYLEVGELEKAENLLGCKYSFSGKIIHGSGRGRKLSFPTANVQVSEQYKLIPGDGVYLVKLEIDREKKFGLCNIGVRPTFEEHDLVIEIYIYHNNDQDLYDQNLKVTLIKRLRNEIKYNQVEELIEQMERDKVTGLQLIKHYNLK